MFNPHWSALDPKLIRTLRSSMTSPFFVHLFLGDAPADPAIWSFAPNLVASHSVVDTSLLSAARNPDIPTTLYGQIPLNHALLVAGNSQLVPRNVVPILTSQLIWRLQNTDDSALNIGQVPSLRIHVVGQEVRQTVVEDQFPVYGQMQVYREITAGKMGGLGLSDEKYGEHTLLPYAEAQESGYEQNFTQGVKYSVLVPGENINI